MRILIATDAWYPQINGVVRTLSTVADELVASWASGRGARAGAVPDRADAELPGSAHRGRTRAAARPHDGRVPARRRAYPGRGADRARRAPSLPAAALAVHDLLSHPRRPLFPGEVRRPGRSRLALQRWFHNAGNGFMVQTDSLEQRAARQGIRQHPPLVPRRRHRAVPADRSATACSTCRGRCSPMSVASRPRRTSTISSSSTCPAPSWWSVTARSLPAYRERYPQRGLRRLEEGRGAEPLLLRQRRVRVPEPVRDLRSGAARGAGLRPAGRGLPGARTDRCDRQGAGRGARPGPPSGGHARPVDPAHVCAANLRCGSPGAAAPRSSPAI